MKITVPLNFPQYPSTSHSFPLNKSLSPISSTSVPSYFPPKIHASSAELHRFFSHRLSPVETVR